MLGTEEIDELLDEIKEIVLLANRNGTLDELLSKIGLENRFDTKKNVFESYKNGKIIVLGESSVKEFEIKKSAEKEGIDKDRVECCLGYENAKKYEYKKLRYNPKYRVVLFGPVPHSSTGKGNSSSVIAEMENEEGYPRVIRLTSNETLKITKSNFKEAIRNLKREDYI